MSKPIVPEPFLPPEDAGSQEPSPTSSPLSPSSPTAELAIQRLKISTPSPTASLSSDEGSPSASTTISATAAKAVEKISSLRIAHQKTIAEIVNMAPEDPKRTYFIEKELIKLGTLLQKLPPHIIDSVPELKQKKEVFFKDLHNLAFERKMMHVAKVGKVDSLHEPKELMEVAEKLSNQNYILFATEDSTAQTSTKYKLRPRVFDDLLMLLDFDRLSTAGKKVGPTSQVLQFLSSNALDQPGDAANYKAMKIQERAREQLKKSPNLADQLIILVESLCVLTTDLLQTQAPMQLKKRAYEEFEKILHGNPQGETRQEIARLLMMLKEKDPDFPQKTFAKFLK